MDAATYRTYRIFVAYFKISFIYHNKSSIR